MTGYERLRMAIIYQAIYDYKKALKRKNGGSIGALERWFKSDWGEALSGNNGTYIIEKCRQSVGMKRKREYVKKEERNNENN